MSRGLGDVYKRQYLRLAGAGEKIIAFRADGDYWRDLGRPEDLAQATKDLAAKDLSGKGTTERPFGKH